MYAKGYQPPLYNTPGYLGQIKPKYPRDLPSAAIREPSESFMLIPPVQSLAKQVENHDLMLKCGLSLVSVGLLKQMQSPMSLASELWPMSSEILSLNFTQSLLKDLGDDLRQDGAAD